MRYFDKYFKKGILLEWKENIPLVKRLFVGIILLSPFLLIIIYFMFKK